MQCRKDVIDEIIYTLADFENSDRSKRSFINNHSVIFYLTCKSLSWDHIYDIEAYEEALDCLLDEYDLSGSEEILQHIEVFVKYGPSYENRLSRHEIELLEKNHLNSNEHEILMKIIERLSTLHLEA
jgi:hypothetical protein